MRASGVLAALAALFVPIQALSQTPTVARIVPPFGPVSGNSIVVVSGTGFEPGAAVTFGGMPATAVTVANSSALTAKPPSHAAGLVDVAVNNPSGQSGSRANAYSYVVPIGQFGIQHYPIPFPDVFSTDITVGPDGALWFLTNGGESLGPDGIARLTTSGSFTNHPLPDPGLLRDIAPGPDGNLWYVRYAPNKIGRMTPAGVATEFPVAPGREPVAVTPGPDGAVWFAQSLVPLLGRITSGGTISEFPIAALVKGITLGPDGALWVAGCDLSGLGVCSRFSTVGPILPFPVPNPVPGVCPQKIVAGPDGGLWFHYGLLGRRIGRLSTTGTFQEFPVPSGLAVHDIAAGADGNLWFTLSDFVDAWVGRITPWGQITEFPLPPGSVPRGITAGADGALWFANGYDIGRVDPGAPPPTSPGSFFTVPPCRLLDTRNADGPLGGPALNAGLTRSFGVFGQCAIPATARAISVNMTVTQGSVPGHLTAFPGGTSQPLVSSVNYRAGQTRANNAVLQLGSAGDVAVISGQPSGTVHFILDVNGYFE